MPYKVPLKFGEMQIGKDAMIVDSKGEALKFGYEEPLNPGFFSGDEIKSYEQYMEPDEENPEIKRTYVFLNGESWPREVQVDKDNKIFVSEQIGEKFIKKQKPDKEPKVGSLGFLGTIKNWFYNVLYKKNTPEADAIEEQKRAHLRWETQIRFYNSLKQNIENMQTKKITADIRAVIEENAILETSEKLLSGLDFPKSNHQYGEEPEYDSTQITDYKRELADRLRRTIYKNAKLLKGRDDAKLSLKNRAFALANIVTCTDALDKLVKCKEAEDLKGVLKNFNKRNVENMKLLGSMSEETLSGFKHDIREEFGQFDYTKFSKNDESRFFSEKEIEILKNICNEVGLIKTMDLLLSNEQNKRMQESIEKIRTGKEKNDITDLCAQIVSIQVENKIRENNNMNATMNIKEELEENCSVKTAERLSKNLLEFKAILNENKELQERLTEEIQKDNFDINKSNACMEIISEAAKKKNPGKEDNQIVASENIQIVNDMQPNAF